MKKILFCLLLLPMVGISQDDTLIHNFAVTNWSQCDSVWKDAPRYSLGSCQTTRKQWKLPNPSYFPPKDITTRAYPMKPVEYRLRVAFGRH